MQFLIERSIPALCIAANREISLIPDPRAKVCPAFAELWGVMVPQAALQEAAISDIVTIYGARNRLALEESKVMEEVYYSRMVAATSRCLKTLPPNLSMLAAAVFFAYERLRSAATGVDPSDGNHVHYRAMVALTEEHQHVDFVRSYVQPAVNGIKLIAQSFLARGQTQTGSINVPQIFRSCTEAQKLYIVILEAHRGGEDVK